MIFKKYSQNSLPGAHAFLSPSKYSWINYTEEKLEETYKKHLAVERGVVLHDFAQRCINLGIKLPKNGNPFNAYINDAIGYRMNPEQVLYYSDNAYGTADSISFNGNLLRIHDLKTGESPVYMHQLEIYAALFCLEYNFDPFSLKMELRIYQKDIYVHIPSMEEISRIMDKIILFDKTINKLRSA